MNNRIHISSLSKLALPFSMVVVLSLLNGNLSGQTFRAEGVATLDYTDFTNLPSFTRPFTAYVHGKQWLIRSVDSKPESPVKYHEIGYNGTNLFTYWAGKAAAESLPPGMSTGGVRIENRMVPEEYGSLIPTVWLGLASAHYFSTLTSPRVAPIWLYPPRIVNYAPTAKWKFLEKPPGILREAEFTETPGWLPPPYQDGFIRARYTVTSWTNLAELTLPLEWHCQEFAAKLSPRGTNRNDTGPAARIRVKISGYELNTRLANYEPAPTGTTLVHDERFAVAKPSVPIIQYVTEEKHFPGTNSRVAAELYAISAHVERMRKPDTSAHTKRVLIITMLCLITILFTFSVQQYYRRKTKTNKGNP